MMNSDKSNFLFFSPERCTGCKSCEMICSLQQTGLECSRKGSCINVNTHPYLYSSIVSVSMDCNCLDGKERCADICSQDAIVFLSKRDAPAMLINSEWLPGAVVSSSEKPDI
jgi:Fe-S-cluster-containing hydrogenase component 2